MFRTEIKPEKLYVIGNDEQKMSKNVSAKGIVPWGRISAENCCLVVRISNALASLPEVVPSTNCERRVLDLRE